MQSETAATLRFERFVAASRRREPFRLDSVPISFGAGWVGVGQVDGLQVGAVQVGVGQVGNGQVGGLQVGGLQVGAVQVGVGQVGNGQVASDWTVLRASTICCPTGSKWVETSNFSGRRLAVPRRTTAQW